MSLEQTNRELAEELEEARDRLYQAQKDRKVETKELQDKSLALAEDLKRARAEAQKYKAGLEKTRFFIYIFAQKREFLGFISVSRILLGASRL